MTSFFHDLENQLRAAARERTSPGPAPEDPPARSPRRRRWLAGGARALPVAVAVAVTLAVVVGALILLGHRGGQTSSGPAAQPKGTVLSQIIASTPPAQLRREYTLIGTATKNVLASPACRVPTPHQAKVIHGAPGQALLSTLGVLRRPPTAADRISNSTVGENYPGTAIYAGGARRAVTVGRTAYYIVPIRETAADQIPSGRCLALQAQALKQALPTIPAKLRTQTVQIQAAFIAYARHLGATPPQDGICQVSVSGNSSSAECGELLSAIQHGVPPTDDNGTYEGLVPDGVASVTLSFPATATRAASSVVGVVHDNMFFARVPADIPSKLNDQPLIVWHGGGRVIKTIAPPPPPESLKQLCRDHPDDCTAMALAEVSSSTGSGKLQRATATPVAAGKSGSRYKK